MINLDQLHLANPANAISGTDILLLQQSGDTKGMFASVLLAWIKAGFIADDITDATVVGLDLLTATDAAEARAAIGAGTSDLALGVTDTTAKAGDWLPDSEDITDATVVGAALLTATDAAAARAELDFDDSVEAVIDAHAPVAAMLPAIPETGVYVLTATDGVLSWELQE